MNSSLRIIQSNIIQRQRDGPIINVSNFNLDYWINILSSVDNHSFDVDLWFSFILFLFSKQKGKNNPLKCEMPADGTKPFAGCSNSGQIHVGDFATSTSYAFQPHPTLWTWRKIKLSEANQKHQPHQNRKRTGKNVGKKKH